MCELKIVGVTGCVAAGKTVVSELFGEILKYDVLDLDLVAHEIMQNNVIINQLQRFFPEIEGKKNVRQIIAKNFVRNRDQSLRIISDILRPEIRKYINNFLQKARLQRRNGVILEIPLLFEKHYQQMCDKIISVSTPFSRRKQMFIERSQNTNKSLLKTARDFQFIADAQFSDAKKRCLANFVVYNGGSKEFLMSQLKKLSEKL